MAGRGGAAHGVIGKTKEDGKPQVGGQLRRNMSRHCEGSLHRWCVREAAKMKKDTKTFEEENKEVGMTVMMTYLKNARRGGGAADFLHDIDLTHLLPGVTNSTKNNSRNTFFELRDDAFEVVTGAVQELFRSEKVTEFSATLDKVTVQHRSYTVLLTFFFHEGSIFCLLNSLLKMNEEDYDAVGTARMVVNSQKETLGLTRTQLANKLLHFRSADLSRLSLVTLHFAAMTVSTRARSRGWGAAAASTCRPPWRRSWGWRRAASPARGTSPTVSRSPGTTPWRGTPWWRS
jgi:hypothetical protein